MGREPTGDQKLKPNALIFGYITEEGHSEPIVIMARDEGETVWERWFTLEDAERLAAKLSRVIAEYRQKLQTGTLIKRKKAKPRQKNPEAT
jgi:aminoglycoside phosphotransferase family enzyme